MRVREHIKLSIHGVTASKFSLLSNTLSILIGLVLFGSLISLSVGVGNFLEKYYTRTMSLTTLLVFDDPESLNTRRFDKAYRDELLRLAPVQHIYYHDIDFADLELTQGRSVTVAFRAGQEADPEIDRLELIAGANLPSLKDIQRPPLVISLARAARLSDLPPQELVGSEVAINLTRALTFEDDDQLTTLYGTIVGIVNETPDECVYVPYSVMATIAAWQRSMTHGASPPSAPPTVDAMPADAPDLSTAEPPEKANHKIDEAALIGASDAPQDNSLRLDC
ncbi:MAG: ABC transporter permease [Planctomycetia bacterium]|nr:ABC transporter permease [Planctomycetia bacterium]